MTAGMWDLLGQKWAEYLANMMADHWAYWKAATMVPMKAENWDDRLVDL